MELQQAREAVAALKFPDWVKSWDIEFDLDEDLQRYVRVWLRVDEDFDVNSHFKSMRDFSDSVREAVWKQDRAMWALVSLDSGAVLDD